MFVLILFSWELAGLSGPAAKEALRGAAELCTLGRDVLVEEVKVRTRDSSRILGDWKGELVKFEVEKTEGGRWGAFSSWRVSSSVPEGLAGFRFVARQDGKDPGREPSELKSGDTLLLAAPDRAALLELAGFDRLPEKYKGLAPLIEMQDVVASRQDGANEINLMDERATRLAAQPEVKDAVRFAKRLELLSEKDQMPERFRRLQDMPLVRDVLAGMAADEQLRGLQPMLSPFAERFYGAARGWRGRQKGGQEQDAEDDKVTIINLEFNLFQAIGALVVIAALAYGASQGVKSQIQPGGAGGRGQEALPVYSLRDLKQ
ncbi:unnamed protein product [Polarella glacialis]|uniref:Uncharacterized protein n=1 Tax=Polarella glacialis TaxID=89957 RepID=A0A813HY65_POLGL|nr:unnamed protein product [Polarella glacialis]